MKRCTKCGIWKPLDEFYREKACRDGHRPDCKACNLARRKARYREDPQERVYRAARRDKTRADHLRRTFDLTVGEYEAMLEEQRGGCATCGRLPKRISLHVDHDHKTHEVRGLLCMQCNNGLGLLQESPELLRDAADYLEGILESAVVREELHRITVDRARALAA
jgi:Autographiviridae endonuclease VII